MVSPPFLHKKHVCTSNKLIKLLQYKIKISFIYLVYRHCSL